MNELQTIINDKNSCGGEKTLKIIASVDGLDSAYKRAIGRKV